MSKPKTESYASVWDAIADTPEQAANLRARAELMQQIAAIVTENGWTQTETLALCADPAQRDSGEYDAGWIGRAVWQINV